MSKKKFLMGALAGVTLGFLFAPKSGEATRKDLKVKFDNLIDEIKNLDATEVRAKIEKQVAELQKLIQDMDKEKALAIAANKAEEVKAKADELVKAAGAAMEPKLKAFAEETRTLAIKATKEVLKKLEDK